MMYGLLITYPVLSGALLILILVAFIALAVFKKTRTLGRILLTVFTVLVILPVAFLFLLTLLISHSMDSFYQYMILIALVYVIAVILFIIWNLFKYKAVKIITASVLAAAVAVLSVYAAYNAYIDSIPVIGENTDLLSQYAPDSEDSKVATLDGEASLRLETDVPRIDGATALYPVYSAFAKAVYPDECLDYEYVMCTTTSGAYDSIVMGGSEIIFVSSPSQKQTDYAKQLGVELEYTPIGSEGFVFFVNANNPIDDLTLEQVQQIYSGEITDWSDLGVRNLGSIKAFQREEGSGSQTRLQKLMEGKKLMTPPTEEIVDGMLGIIERTSDYKNYKNAIGFSFRFYSTEMVKNNQIKLLSIDGVYPSEENIENGTYPLSGNFYAVTRKDKSESVQKFLDWMLTPEAQSLIEKTGYTPIS